MGLMPVGSLQCLQFPDLDTFMLEMHCAEIAKALDLLCRFAQRVLPKTDKVPSAPFWRVSGPVVITRDNLNAFRNGVRRLVNLLGRAGRRPSPEQRPEYALLHAAAVRTIRLFEQYAI